VSVGQIREGMGQGRVLGADAALEQKMVDGIATFDEVLKKMRRASKTATPTGQAAPNRPSRLQQAQTALALL
jgi:ClpP class serine protease